MWPSKCGYLEMNAVQIAQQGAPLVAKQRIGEEIEEEDNLQIELNVSQN